MSTVLINTVPPDDVVTLTKQRAEHWVKEDYDSWQHIDGRMMFKQIRIIDVRYIQ
jgi:hypothetical protein